MVRWLRLLALSTVAGIASGAGVLVFLIGLDAATTARLDHPWLVWLLPLGGAVVAGAYHAVGGRARAGTAGVIAEVNELANGVPARMAPMILAGSVTSHAVGASVGREGGALQVAASITDTGARALRLPAEDRRLLLAAALAAGWGAAFAVPITGMAFAWRFARRQRIRALPLTALAAVAAERTVSALGYEHRRPAPVGDVDWSVGLILLLVVAGLLFGVLARWFVASLRRVRGLAARHLPHPAARGAVGGFALLLLVAIAGRDVLGLSLPLLDDSLGGGTTPWWTAPMKLVATAVSLGTGFVGGDVTPLFVIGASAGATIASVVGAASARVSLVAALGSTVTFGAASSATVVGVVLAAERFGRHAIVPALVVALAARLAAGRPALYAESH